MRLREGEGHEDHHQIEVNNEWQSSRRQQDGRNAAQEQRAVGAGTGETNEGPARAGDARYNAIERTHTDVVAEPTDGWLDVEIGPRTVGAQPHLL